MGVLTEEMSMQDSGLAERGVEAEKMVSEGKVPVTGVVSCGNLGLVAGMMGGREVGGSGSGLFVDIKRGLTCVDEGSSQVNDSRGRRKLPTTTTTSCRDGSACGEGRGERERERESRQLGEDEQKMLYHAAEVARTGGWGRSSLCARSVSLIGAVLAGFGGKDDGLEAGRRTRPSV